MRKPEILAPAGSVKSAYSAINAGCDAVYMGGKKYGARAFADNPDDEILSDIIDDVHFFNKKIYITVNTVFNENDFKGLYDFIKLIYEKGADAVIVQDLGVMNFISGEFPGLPIHASTQMNILQASAAELIKNYGVTRIVPARELSFAELSHIRKCTELEIEAFVHGALCFSYSGQCLMSSLIGGRSGNKGACAQPCRKKYSCDPKRDKLSHKLSLKDLCSLDYIPELVNAGIDSFKIEGRMKKPEYVALTVNMYRKYTDMYFELGDKDYRSGDFVKKELKNDIRLLQDIYNRGGFTCGYLTQNKERKNMMSEKRPGHQGVKVGKITGIISGKNTIEILFTQKTHPQDILEIRNTDGETLHVHTLKDAGNIGERIKVNAGYNAKNIMVGYEVFRVRNNELIKEVLEKFPPERKKKHVTGIFKASKDERASLTVWISDSDDKCVTVYGDVVRKAEKHIVTKQLISEKIKVSGDSLFEWDRLDIEADGDIFISLGSLKDIRRKAFEELYNLIICVYHRESFLEKTLLNSYKTASNGKIDRELIAECRNKIQFECTNLLSDVDIIYLHMENMSMNAIKTVLAEAEKPVYLVMPRIFGYEEQAYFEKNYDMRVIGSYSRFAGMVICSLEELAWIYDNCTEENFEIRAADNLYARNSYAAGLLKELGISVCQSPAEMTYEELLSLKDCDYDVAVYKRDTAMVTAICMDGYNNIYDSYGNIYPVIWNDNFKYTEIMNYETRDYTNMIPVNSFKRLRVSFYDEKPSDIRRIIKRLRERSK